MSSCAEGELESSAALTPEQREQLRVQKIHERKLHIASLGSAIISAPYTNVRADRWSGIRLHRCFLAADGEFYNMHVCLCAQMKRVKELRGMLMESDPCVAVTVRKLVMVSLMEIFKDIAPTYRIRPLTSAEKAVKVTRFCCVSSRAEEAPQTSAFGRDYFLTCTGFMFVYLYSS